MQAQAELVKLEHEATVRNLQRELQEATWASLKLQKELKDAQEGNTPKDSKEVSCCYPQYSQSWSYWIHVVVQSRECAAGVCEVMCWGGGAAGISDRVLLKGCAVGACRDNCAIWLRYTAHSASCNHHTMHTVHMTCCTGTCVFPKVILDH